MKKIISISICLLLVLLVFTGCGTKKEETKKKETKEVDPSVTMINGEEFHLTKNTTFQGLLYTIAEEFEEGVHPNYVQYRYTLEDGSNLLFFRVFYYEGKDMDYIKNDLAIEGDFKTTDGKNDFLEYKSYFEPRDDGTIHFYFITKDNIAYAINFISKYDIKDFEEKVVKTLKF